MAATGDNLIKTSLVPDGAALRYVDHAEQKIHSPEKETFSPSKPLKRSNDTNTSTGEPILDIVNSEPCFQSPVKDIANESVQSDSGLDNSTSSEEVAGHFVERQESHVSVDEPDSVKSPIKMVTDLFSFVDEPTSLDAMNNNSEQFVETTQLDKAVNQEAEVIECYSGMDVDLHGAGEKAGEIDEDRDVDTKDTEGQDAVDAGMNLYWYNGTCNLDLDLSELESLNNQNENVTSNVQTTVGENYYKDRLEDTYITPQNVGQQKVNPTTAEESGNREKWSPAFESASSRFLDLASEMKSDTKAKPDAATSMSQDSEMQHPWGLDNENQVYYLSMPETEVHDELPLIFSLDPRGMSPDSADGDVPEEEDDIDQTDAIGYMIRKDQNQIVEAINVADSKNKNDESNYKIESEQIVSTVVQKVHSQMMKTASDYKSDDSSAVTKKPIEDVVDGMDINGVIEEAVESTTAMSVESVSTLSHRNENTSNNCIISETIECTPQSMVYSEPHLPAVEEICEPIEVRRKFRLVADVEEKLINFGAKLIQVENYVDEYLDDENYSLCLSDCWLRLRNKKFEMKVNEALQGSLKTDSSNELINEKEVELYLLEKYGGKLLAGQADQDLPLDVIVDKLGFTEFATFETVKKSYQLDDCVVDLELTDFGGLQVCEVEAVADRPSQVLQALDSIKAVVVNLDLKPLQGV